MNNDQVKRVLVKLTEMAQTSRQDIVKTTEMIEELGHSIMQLNILTLELSKNTAMTFDALTKRIIDLEMAVGLKGSEIVEEADDEDQK